MNWKHILNEQPKDGELIIQIDPPYEGHYRIGMIKYEQICSFVEVLKYYKDAGYYPDWYWIKASEFPFPNWPERLNEKTFSEGFFPPPWNIIEHPEKTEGWIAFQEAMRNSPDYYKMR